MKKAIEKEEESIVEMNMPLTLTSEFSKIFIN